MSFYLFNVNLIKLSKTVNYFITERVLIHRTRRGFLSSGVLWGEYNNIITALRKHAVM